MAAINRSRDGGTFALGRVSDAMRRGQSSSVELTCGERWLRMGFTVKDWPDWWEWELEFTSHLEKRMDDRDFTELDLRAMLERAESYRPSVVAERWMVRTRHRGAEWAVIVEPDSNAQLLVVVTAYPVKG